MNNISGFGLKVRVTASVTFPLGFTVTAFADDADPFDFPDLTVADSGRGLNGDLLIWSRPSGIEPTLNIIPTSGDDANLGTLLEANRVGKGKTSAKDIITMVATYPNGQVLTLNKGAIIVGSAMPSVANSGRIKTRKYSFTFENLTKSGEVNTTV